MAYATVFHWIRQHVQNWQVNWRIKPSLPHLQAPLRIPVQLCEALGRMHRGEKGLFQSTPSASGLVAAISLFAWPFFFPDVHMYIWLVSQPFWNRVVEVLEDMVLAQTILVPFSWRWFGTDLVQSSETSLNHNCQQTASTRRGNSRRTAHKITSSVVLFMVEREGSLCAREFLLRKASSW